MGKQGKQTRIYKYEKYNFLIAFFLAIKYTFFALSQNMKLKLFVKKISQISRFPRNMPTIFVGNQ